MTKEGIYSQSRQNKFRDRDLEAQLNHLVDEHLEEKRKHFNRRKLNFGKQVEKKFKQKVKKPEIVDFELDYFKSFPPRLTDNANRSMERTVSRQRKQEKKVFKGREGKSIVTKIRKKEKIALIKFVDKRGNQKEFRSPVYLTPLNNGKFIESYSSKAYKLIRRLRKNNISVNISTINLVTGVIDTSPTNFNLKLVQRLEEARRIRKEQRKQARKLSSGNATPDATKLREDAKIPYHKAKKISLSISKEQSSQSEKELIKALRKRFLFNRFGNELGLSNAVFMAYIRDNDGRSLKELANLFTHKKIKDMVVEFKTNTSNLGVDRYFDGKTFVEEMPVANVYSKKGDVLLQITFSQPTLIFDSNKKKGNNFFINFQSGKVNFYHRNQRIEGKKALELIKRWLGVSLEIEG